MAIYPYGPQDSVKYTLDGPDGSQAVFNDPDDANYVGFARFTGLDDAEVRESIEDRSGDHGAVQGLNWQGRRPVTASIEIVPTSTVDRNEKWALLRRAVNALQEDGTLSWQPDGGLAVQLAVRKNGPIRREEGGGLVVKVQIALVAANPDIVSQTLHTDSGTTGVEVITNQGDGEAKPVITVTATSGNSVAISNEDKAEALVIPSFSVSSYLADFNAEFLDSSDFQGYSVHVDNSDNVYIADTFNHRVLKYNSAGTLQWSSGSLGGGNGQFRYPYDVTADNSGNVYVADTANSRVQKLDSSGVYQAQVATATVFPTAIGIELGTPTIYCGGGVGDQIHVMNSSLTISATWSLSGTGAGQISNLAIGGIETDSGGNVWLSDSELNRVQKFNSAGTYQSVTFGTTGVGNGQFNGAGAISRDSNGDFFVVDRNNSRIQRFSSAGAYEAQFGTNGTGDGQFVLPSGVAAATDQATTLYVVDSTFRLQKLVVAATRVAEFDFAKRRVTTSGVNAYGIVNPAVSEWWTLAPGDNNVLVTGASSWNIEWRDTWL